MQDKTIAIVKDVEQFKAMAAQWDGLAVRFNTPLLRHDWFEAGAQSLHDRDELHLVTVFEGPVLRAAAPTVLVRSGGIKRLELIGSNEGEPSGLLYDDDRALTVLIEALVSLRLPLVLKRIMNPDLEPRRFTDACRSKAVCLFRKPPDSLWIPLKTGQKEFEEAFPPRRFRRLRRKQRKAESMGKVEFVSVTHSGERLEELLDELIRVEHASWKGLNRTSIKSLPRMQKFIRSYARSADRAGRLRLYFMRIDGQNIACRLAVEDANRLWELKIGFDDKYLDCSPGMLLTHEVVRIAFEQGLDAFEFLGAAEPWESMWTDQTHQYLTARVYPYTFSGMALLASDVTRHAWNNIFSLISKYRFNKTSQSNNKD